MNFKTHVYTEIYNKEYYSFKDSLKILNLYNNQMDLITQRNQQASPDGPSNHMGVTFW
jgi:hypothetical protein